MTTPVPHRDARDRHTDATSLVLVLDNDEARREDVVRRLRADRRLHPIGAADGSRALATLRVFRPALLLVGGSDYRGALTTLADVRKDSAFAVLPVVVYRAADDANARHRAADLGAVDFLVAGGPAWPRLAEVVSIHLRWTAIIAAGDGSPARPEA